MKFDYAMNLMTDTAYTVEERERSRSPRRDAEEHEGQATGAPEPEPMEQEPAVAPAPGLRGRSRGRARGRGRSVMPGARGAGQHRARPTPVGHFRPAATLDEGPEHADNLEVIFAEFDSALEQGHQALVWGSDAQARKLQEQVAGGKQVKLIKVRCSAARLLTPQPQLHAADAPWRLTLVKSGEPPTPRVMD